MHLLVYRHLLSVRYMLSLLMTTSSHTRTHHKDAVVGRCKAAVASQIEAWALSHPGKRGQVHLFWCIPHLLSVLSLLMTSALLQVATLEHTANMLLWNNACLLSPFSLLLTSLTFSAHVSLPWPITPLLCAHALFPDSLCR